MNRQEEADDIIKALLTGTWHNTLQREAGLYFKKYEPKDELFEKFKLVYQAWDDVSNEETTKDMIKLYNMFKKAGLFTEGLEEAIKRLSIGSDKYHERYEAALYDAIDILKEIKARRLT